MVSIESGSFTVGSGPDEREWAYDHSPSAVRLQGWYDAWELEPRSVVLAGFSMDAAPVTQSDYALFVSETSRRPPWISKQDYKTQGFLVHPYATVRKYLWVGGAPPADLLEHPVVLVNQGDAKAYCAWQGKRLPTEFEWEAACRGRDGRRFPWGDDWEPGRAHNRSTGTAPVGRSDETLCGNGGLGILGNVFEWTSSEFQGKRATVKGCSWDDADGSCRCAFRHGRPLSSRHVLIGFRCARDR